MSEIRDQIFALIPAGDPHSDERKRFCEAAVEAIAKVCFEHSDGDLGFAMKGLQSAFVEGTLNFQKRLQH